MARYVLLNRLAGRGAETAPHLRTAEIDAALERLTGARIVSDHRPQDGAARRVVVLEAAPARIKARMASLPPGVIIEPVRRRPLRRAMPIMELEDAERLPPLTVRSTRQSYEITITGGGKPLARCTVRLFVQKPGQSLRAATAVTDRNGRAVQGLPAGYRVRFIKAMPAAGFWSVVARAPASGGSIACEPLPPARRHGGWWHAAMGIDVAAGKRGAGIRVGVIDSGCGPHPNLRHVTLVGAFIDNRRLPATQARDPHGHGTHTTGIIGARPRKAGDYAGLAPDCELFHARVSLDGHDIVRAIDVLAGEFRCDLINISLGDSEPLESETDAIQHALEHGTLCICAAGNRDVRGALDFPAALPECVAVSAIGHEKWGPAGSWAVLHRLDRGDFRGKEGMFFSATSSFGTRLTCTAPGVGIVSTVPDRRGSKRKGGYMEMSGTSMATPAACGALAVILSGSAEYRKLPRGRERAELARRLLLAHCRSVGLHERFQGRGLPRV